MEREKEPRTFLNMEPDMMLSFPDQGSSQVSLTKDAHFSVVRDSRQRPSRSGWLSFRFIFANVLCVVLLVWSIVLVAYPIYLARASQFTNTKRTVYTTFITVIASCINLYLVGHIRSEWLCTIDLKLAKQTSLRRIESLNRHWRTALGISSLKERWLERRTWLMQFSLVFTALLTSALVAAMTPTNSQQYMEFALSLPTGTSSGCTYVVSNVTDLPEAVLYFQKVSWPMDNGSQYIALQAPTCPAGQILGLMGQLNDVAPDSYSYNVQGTAVDSSAIGSPQSLVTYNSGQQGNYTTALQDATDGAGVDLTSTTQCVPVLASNPVTCRAAGNITFPNAYEMLITDGPSCNNTAIYNFNVTQNSSHAVTASVCAGDTVGAGTLLFAATNDYALGLAASLSDIQFAYTQVIEYAGKPIPQGKPITYGIACDFDIPASIQWRQAVLDIQFTPTNDVPFSRMIYANESCLPLSDVTTEYAAMAATGFSEPLDQFTPDSTQLSGLTGHVLARPGVPSVNGTIGLVRAGPWAFNESTNALEDVLGLIAGLAMSQIPQFDATTSGNYDMIKSVPMFDQLGSSGVQVVRIGPGKPWALVFAIPPLLAWGFVIWLRFKVVKGQPAYRSSHLTDLLDLGRSTSVSVNDGS